MVCRLARLTRTRPLRSADQLTRRGRVLFSRTGISGCWYCNAKCSPSRKPIPKLRTSTITYWYNIGCEITVHEIICRVFQKESPIPMGMLGGIFESEKIGKFLQLLLFVCMLFLFFRKFFLFNETTNRRILKLHTHTLLIRLIFFQTFSHRYVYWTKNGGF